MGIEESQQLEDGMVLSSLETDTIGEILNISMGSAATAISTMLDKQVVISTPTVEVRRFNSMDYAALEPAVLVKINYVEGISGSNVMIFRQRDMQIILNLLMGNDEEPSDDFVFDELSMSAACEVMNQMMGASATALSDFLGMVVNISTPEAMVVDSNDAYRNAVNVNEGDEVVAVSFSLSIAEVMDTNFASILECSLAKEMVQRVIGFEEDTPVVEAPAAPEPAAVAPAVQQAPPAAQAPQQAPPAAAQMAPPQGGAPMAAAPGMPPQGMPGAAMPAGPEGYTQPGYPGGYPPYYGYPGYPGYPPAPYPGYPPYGGADGTSSQVMHQPMVNVQNTQFPQFAVQPSPNPNINGNMDLLMGLPLEVRVEIGSAKRKIKEVIEFGQGTVIELDKQAGAPVDIVVNGKLLARGDVVVIDDNFGVRITEILGTRELLESLKDENI